MMCDRKTLGITSPTKRIFISLKREWLTGNVYQTRESAIADTHIKFGYYNTQRIHTMISDMTSIEFEKELNKVAGFI